MIISTEIRRLHDYMARLVHPSAHGDAMAFSRHRAFIVSHLIGGGLALAGGTAYVLLLGELTAVAAGAFAWLVSPILIAIYLSKTGRLDLAHLISAANLTGLVTFVAGLTGGITSFVMPWMLIVPLEAALSNNRRVILGALGLAALGTAGLGFAEQQGLLSGAATTGLSPMALAILGTVSALLYAAALAGSVQKVQAEAAEAVRRSEQRYRLLAETASDLITCHDRDGGVVFATHAAERIFETSPEALEGEGLLDKVHPSDQAAVRQALEQSVIGAAPVAVEFRLHTVALDQREDRWAEMRIQPLRAEMAEDGFGRGGVVVAVTRDITEHKAQELALLQARDLAESANKAKTQFLATMSHELRTPLNAIIGFADILKRELFGEIGEDRYREYSRLIHDSGEHLLSVVNEILDMSKIEAGKYSLVVENFDVERLVKSCCDLMSHAAAEKSITIRHTLPADLPELAADRRACKQMLLNLMSNAVKFTEEGGEVKVAVTMADGMMSLRVADNGIGIAPDDLAGLGDPFVQVETNYSRKFDGAGLGLCIVKGLARLHGGTLDIVSEPGIGTAVTISLPCDISADQPETPPPARDLEMLGQAAL